MIYVIKDEEQTIFIVKEKGNRLSLIKGTSAYEVFKKLGRDHEIIGIVSLEEILNLTDEKFYVAL